MESNKSTPRHHKLFCGSSYDRYIDVALFMWPSIIEKYPDAELHICYGWDWYVTFHNGNPERMQWMEKMKGMMNQKGIFHHGRVGQDELARIRKMCGIWFYPTHFTEINCITANLAQNDGLVPVTMTLGALKETVRDGILVDGDIRQFHIQEAFLKKLLDLMGDKEEWKRLSHKVQKDAVKTYWDNIAPKWIEVFKEPVSMPKVSVVTVTIREGFWNIMAYNLSKQTYKNIEWIIVDDYKEDRSEIAKKYSKKFNLDIKYFRGNKKARRYGIASANNIGWKNAKGELLVYIQDFILIEQNGIESLVDIYRHHPKALIAPVDERYFCKEPDMENKEDWWHGDINILGRKDWSNARVKNEGIRHSVNPFEFEMNYGAIPKKVVSDLNGWWEFFDDGIGYDNTEIAYRAIESGYDLIVDDTNICKTINLWPHLKGSEFNMVNREYNMNNPRYIYFLDNNFPFVRDEELDNKTKLEYEIPKEIPEDKAAEWTANNQEEIIKKWTKR